MTLLDLCVIGGGSGGFAAAWAAARLGASVLLVEKHGLLGGNAVRCGVNTWESVAGATGVPFDLYRQVLARHGPDAIAINRYGRHVCYGDDYPGGEFVIDRSFRYLDTLRRAGTSGFATDGNGYREHCHAVPFEPDAMADTQLALLRESGVEVRLGTAFARVHSDAGLIHRVDLTDGSSVAAHTFLDATADVLLCSAAGCEIRRGQDARADHDEPHAPEQRTDRVNGVTLIYRITPRTPPGIDPLDTSDGTYAGGFPAACFNQYPNGRDLNVNMLPTMQGDEAMRMLDQRGYAAVYAECRRRVLAHWHHLQTTRAEFRGYRLAWIAPGLGVRESNRVVAEYMLTEHDLLAGLSRQRHEDVIAIADHPLDVHGAHAAGVNEVPGPFGVPMRCLVPRGMRNLLVACRGAGFSSLAASSCRLSRTMMQLGQAAGTAAALAASGRCAARDVPPDVLRRSLREQHVQLEHPMPPDLREHLLNERIVPDATSTRMVKQA